MLVLGVLYVSFGVVGECDVCVFYGEKLVGVNGFEGCVFNFEVGCGDVGCFEFCCEMGFVLRVGFYEDVVSDFVVEVLDVGDFFEIGIEGEL